MSYVLFFGAMDVEAVFFGHVLFAGSMVPSQSLSLTCGQSIPVIFSIPIDDAPLHQLFDRVVASAPFNFPLI